MDAVLSEDSVFSQVGLIRRASDDDWSRFLLMLYRRPLFVVNTCHDSLPRMLALSGMSDHALLTLHA